MNSLELTSTSFICSTYTFVYRKKTTSNVNTISKHIDMTRTFAHRIYDVTKKTAYSAFEKQSKRKRIYKSFPSFTSASKSKRHKRELNDLKDRLSACCGMSLHD